MPWIELWRPTRISVDAWLASADRLAAIAGGNRVSDWLKSGGEFFHPEAVQIIRELHEINESSDLPDDVRQRLAIAVHECNSRVNGLTNWLEVMCFAMQLTHVHGLLDNAHARSEAPRRNRVERAFEHLNRSLVVDREFQERWLQAFASGEVECEKLGAVHLLLHGVFAFKANSKGGRTGGTDAELLDLFRIITS